jgi:hypothetical protein
VISLLPRRHGQFPPEQEAYDAEPAGVKGRPDERALAGRVGSSARGGTSIIASTNLDGIVRGMPVLFLWKLRRPWG